MPGLWVVLRQKGLTDCLLVQRVAAGSHWGGKETCSSPAWGALPAVFVTAANATGCWRVEVTDDHKLPFP